MLRNTVAPTPLRAKGLFWVRPSTYLLYGNIFKKSRLPSVLGLRFACALCVHLLLYLFTHLFLHAAFPVGILMQSALEKLNQYPNASVSPTSRRRSPLMIPNLAEMTGNLGLASRSPDPVGRITCFQMTDPFTARLMDSFVRGALAFLENQEFRK